jgi:hypothetical protein
MLGIRLLRVAPASPVKPVHAALVEVHARAEEVQAALHARLLAHTRIASGSGKDGQAASELLAALFPDGLSFLNAAYEEEWLHSNTLLQRIEAEALRASLEQLAAAAFVQHVIEAHQALGNGLGLGATVAEELPGVGPVVTLLEVADELLDEVDAPLPPVPEPAQE